MSPLGVGPPRSPPAFQPRPPGLVPPGPLGLYAGSGRLAAFQIRFIFHQHHSRQGTIRWQEGGKTQPFRSTLELVRILEHTLQTMEDLSETRVPASLPDLGQAE